MSHGAAGADSALRSPLRGPYHAQLMNWLTNYVLPKIRAFARRDVPDNLWKKCPGCEQMLFHRELAASLDVCRHCGHHFRIGSAARFKLLFDDGAFDKIALPQVPADPPVGHRQCVATGADGRI